MVAVARSKTVGRLHHDRDGCAVSEDLAGLSACEAARRIAAREITALALVDACLARIDSREAEIRAWQHLDAEAARAQALARDAAPAPLGPLHGVPVGVKDLIDTAESPTEYGSPIYEGHRPSHDAECVRLLRAAGAVVLGKTVTTEFATFKPPPTRNPHHRGHTPGGSSSGSAAAVAEGMVPAALGSQTAGSVIRPAAFCGVVGFKPSFAAIAVGGVKPLAAALDTLGTFARSVEDAALVARAIGRTGGPLAAPDPGPLPLPAVALCRTPEWDRAEPAMVTALEAVLERLASAGARTARIDMPEPFAELARAQNDIMWAQTAKSLAHEWETRPELLSPGLTARLEEGAAVSPARLAEALALVERCRGESEALFAGHDLLLTAAAAGEAPSIETTGDPVFNRAWTALHVPCLTLPAGSGPHRLPLGAQLVARQGEDARLVAWARWVETVLAV
jgi:amidase